MTHASANRSPTGLKSMPHGLLMPWATTSNVCRVGWYRHTPALIGWRSASGVPGLPTFEWVNTPWQPYNQPSGPQVNVFSVSCVS